MTAIARIPSMSGRNPGCERAGAPGEDSGRALWSCVSYETDMSYLSLLKGDGTRRVIGRRSYP
ncbi:hypothetical protein GCM10010112_61240 [Actinoplanes lobatus]|uniref:Uncharacterized protein n=1 Tax=Actinoplanes lobatus TaxID=113568 RepID=A0ABQ4AP75_9ACTN|nr:hypothetical protein GCM10010112_61240 [Actinoplanes lobatus]GIE42314.1 hypothetical protein Alo02nite_52120 [Actinoplanes lobatus]